MTQRLCKIESADGRWLGFLGHITGDQYTLAVAMLGGAPRTSFSAATHEAALLVAEYLLLIELSWGN